MLCNVHVCALSRDNIACITKPLVSTRLDSFALANGVEGLNSFFNHIVVELTFFLFFLMLFCRQKSLYLLIGSLWGENGHARSQVKSHNWLKSL